MPASLKVGWAFQLQAVCWIGSVRHEYPDRAGYTWWNMVTRVRERNIGWRLNHFFVSPDLRDRIVEAEIHADSMGSDHCPCLTLDS